MACNGLSAAMRLGCFRACDAGVKNHSTKRGIIMSKGRIDVTLPAADVAECVALLDQVEQRLPFLLRLKPSEKIRLVKPRAGAAEVMQTVVDLQTQAGIPPAPGDAMVADVSVYVGLTTIKDRLEALARRIEDTHMQAGSEAWNESLIRYGMLRQLERSKPELKTGLDRIRPLITSRSNRRSPAPGADAPQAPEPIETEPAE
jgi:hypothetical protein